jgi:hypothetical protein
MQINNMKPMIAIKILTMNTFAHVSIKHLPYKFIQDGHEDHFIKTMVL